MGLDGIAHRGFRIGQVHYHAQHSGGVTLRSNYHISVFSMRFLTRSVARTGGEEFRVDVSHLSLPLSDKLQKGGHFL